MADDLSITLPSGGSVTMRAAADIRAKEKIAVSSRMMEANFTQRGAWVIAVAEMAALLVDSWTIPYLPGAKIPRQDPDVFGELKPGDYDAIVEHPEVVKALAIIFPSRITPDDSATPGSPTEPSGD